MWAGKCRYGHNTQNQNLDPYHRQRYQRTKLNRQHRDAGSKRQRNQRNDDIGYANTWPQILQENRNAQ
ncbi:hypothetical protein D3C80_1776510 [compost metagenome]